MCKGGDNSSIDTMNILFDTINKQIYIMASQGSDFEMKIIPMDENFTRKKLIVPVDPSNKETS